MPAAQPRAEKEQGHGQQEEEQGSGAARDRSATPSTYSDPVSTSKASFRLAGQPRGATVYFRALTLDPKLPNGKSDWTPWVAVVVG